MIKRYAFIALGSNLGDSVELVFKATEKLKELSIRPLLRSSLWRSTAVDCPPGSGDFINAVVALIPSSSSPETLLNSLQQIEREFGRRPKTVHNEARPIDLDLIAFRNEIRTSPELMLPHPRAHLRRFVLAP